MMAGTGYALGEKTEETACYTLYRSRCEGDAAVLLKVLRAEGGGPSTGRGGRGRPAPPKSRASSSSTRASRASDRRVSSR
jgi:hypothetical protein